MEPYLEAECVIQFLYSIGFITGGRDWKHNTKEYYYPARFYNGKATISFNIDVKGSIHCISKSALHIISVRYNVNVTDIFNKCSIPPLGQA